MKRRRFIVGTVAVLSLADRTRAQEPGSRGYRIGYVASGPRARPPTMPSRAFRQGLLDAGYVEGRDIVLDRRCAPTNEMLGRVVGDVLKAMPHVFVSSGSLAALAMRERAPHIPVVFVDVHDPIGLGLVQSLARPGTNMTGLANVTVELTGKRVQFPKEALPGARVISTLETPGPIADTFRREVNRAGATEGWQVRHFTVHTASDLPGAFQAMKKGGAEAFIVMQSSLFWTERALLANLAAQPACRACTTSRRKSRQAAS